MEKLICGLKLTHDGALAVIADDQLLFSVEAEKLENRPRYSAMNTTADLTAVLRRGGFEPSDVDTVAVDGWGRRNGVSQVTILDEGTSTTVEVADYADKPGDDPLAGRPDKAPLFGQGLVGFHSYTHATDHALASFCSSPFAEAGQAALIVVWDGGMPPCLYHYDPATRSLRLLRQLTTVVGGLYPVFASHLAPFRSPSGPLDSQHEKLETLLLPVSGKAMAYAALGKPDASIISVMSAATKAKPLTDAIHLYRWTRAVLNSPEAQDTSDATLTASIQQYLGTTLLDGLTEFLRDEPGYRGLPLCLSGGCALNIKWNASLRGSGLFEDVWVPPFPNDAGSAIGAACAEMIRTTGRSALRWSVFAGPELVPSPDTPAGWRSRPCTPAELGRLLADTGEPVVALTGRAEIGPRALGHRSILAPATSVAMRDRLNEMKNREGYRPVAPICLVDAAPEIFAPGTPDPYMLFEHDVRPEWAGKVPAIVHVDGSARLQTVGQDNDFLYEVLSAYRERTGIPVLCNTSANFNGSGFFPDAVSALRWAGTQHVYADGMLYTAEESRSDGEHR
ncbi:carbamoyltransferase N-terminal domain-containing protein [Amycolatopsis pithecellobii]|uniref:Carbamoyltransferase n=1 Tax=Amycolatopsis pithecellobii TaxID=664692 RepID=A0A6N7ZCP2_9PSEU|nr:carbamoyltransferase N-terminal domain-containing protein [Amycolatopsis pithecellobii]MTD59533.1 carbamoyltransferase [Amycolatopsis pithecellobii]